MNRIYSLVWNRALRTLQVASELARSSGGGTTGAAGTHARHRPLAMACMAALGIATLALPAWSASCPAGASPIGSATGAAGTTGSNGSGTNGGTAAGGPSGSYMCLVSGYFVNGGAGGDGAYSTGGAGGAGGDGFVGNGFKLANDGGINGGNGGIGYYAAGGSGGDAVVGGGLGITNDGSIRGGRGGQGVGASGGTGGMAIVATGNGYSSIVNNQTMRGGAGGNGTYQVGGAGGNGGAGVGGSQFTLTNNSSLFGGYGGVGYDAAGGNGAAAITGDHFSVINSAGGIGGGHGGSGYQGNGGAGGDGIDGTDIVVRNGSQIFGGGGGTGGWFSAKGNGGAGGNGVVVAGQSTIVNANYISGGHGGNGLPIGGTGGAGIIATGSGVAVSNSGDIHGGSSGQGAYGGASGAGGAGVVATGGATIANLSSNGSYGGIYGGLGANGGFDRTKLASGAGGNGGAGISGSAFTQAAAGTQDFTLKNGGYIVGGNGGYGVSAAAGAGGAGVSGVGFVAENDVVILGGNGGQGYNLKGGTDAYTGGAGGAGVIGSGFTLTNAGSTSGIGGGNGGLGYFTAAGSGGAGVSGDNFTATNNTLILGGKGGNGIYAAGGTGGAGVIGTGFYLANSGAVYGGAGGAGVYAAAGDGGLGAGGRGFTAINAGVIAGGVGGNASNGAGGNGGAGVSGNSLLLVNLGYIGGGNGGTGATAGAGGVGIIATGNSGVLNAGTIVGGVSGDGSQQADAVDFSGGGNQLALENGFAFKGNVVSSSGSTHGGDELSLAGSVNGTFDASSIVATAPTGWTGSTQYYGFSNYAMDGTGTWMLTGTTTAVTPWTLDSGILSIANDGSLGATSGALTFAGGTLENTSALTTARAIHLPGAGTLQTDADFTDSGSLSGTGALTKTGAGTLTLNGNGSAFTGSTQVMAGTLLVGGDGFANATLGSAVTVAHGATVGGFGTLGSLDLMGTLSPGASIGTLKVTGNAVFASGSTYLADVSPTGQSDQLAVGGAVAINGGTLQANASGTGTWAPLTKYTLVTGAGGVTGQFSALTNLPTAYGGLLYAPNAVYLVLATQNYDLGSSAATLNQRNTATGVQSLGFGNQMFLSLAVIDPAAQRAALDMTSGEFHASQQAARVDDSRYVREAMDQRLVEGDNDAEASKVGGTKLTAWVHGWGHWGHLDGDGNAATTSDNGNGLLVGADLPVGATGRIGVTGGASRDTITVGERASSARMIDQWLGMYGGFMAGPVALRAGVAYAWGQIPAYRQVAFPGIAPEMLSSNTNANTFTGYVEAAWRVRMAGGEIEPYVNLANVQAHSAAGNETGGAAALHMDSETVDTSLSTLGARGSWQLGSRLAFNADLGWQHAFGDITPQRTQRFLVGGDAFTVYGVPLAKNAGVVKLGLDWRVSSTAHVTFGYDGLLGGGTKDNAAQASFNVAF